MKRAVIVRGALVLLMIAFVSPPALPQGSGETSVTAAAVGVFPDGTWLFGLSINGQKFGSGVLIASGGSALGDFETLLLGTSALGQAQNIAIEGKAQTGLLNAPGSATFNGVCTVDLGDGSIPLNNVPFAVTLAYTEGGIGTMLLAIGDTTLPTSTLTAGSVTINET